MRVLTVVGARPQFVKAAAVSRALRKRHEEVLVHTGQHYDEEMSSLFFRELDLPRPDYHLGVGSGSHGVQTSLMLPGIEAAILDERPDVVLVYGDTNSTLAGALAAAKLNVPVAHVEAGCRSYDHTMPEEINRVVTDHLSTLLFCPTRLTVDNLTREGITSGVHQVGDVMLDLFLERREDVEERSRILHDFGLTPGGYLVATIHRAANTDQPERLGVILEALEGVGEEVIFPVHPRTWKAIAGLGRSASSSVRLIEPVGYLEMQALVRHARLVLTDSGGVQKEAFFLGTPCLTLRSTTEWPETVQAGWNRLVNVDREAIQTAVRSWEPRGVPPEGLFGDGRAAERIAELLESWKPSTRH